MGLDQATTDARGIEAKAKSGDDKGAYNAATEAYDTYSKNPQHTAAQTAAYWTEVTTQLKADGVLNDVAIGFGEAHSNPPASANTFTIANDDGTLSKSDLSNVSQFKSATAVDVSLATTLQGLLPTLENAAPATAGTPDTAVTQQDLNAGAAYLQQAQGEQAAVSTWLSGTNGTTLLSRVDHDGNTNGNTHDGNIAATDIATALKDHPNDFTASEKAFLQQQLDSLNAGTNPLAQKGNINGDSLTAAYNSTDGGNLQFQDVLNQSQAHVVAGADASHPAEVVYPNGDTRSFEYDSSGNLTQVTETSIDQAPTVYRNDGNGWGPVDSSGTVQPDGRFAPTVAPDGTYTFYTADPKTGQITTHQQTPDQNGYNPADAGASSTASRWNTIESAPGAVIPGVTDASGKPLAGGDYQAPGSSASTTASGDGSTPTQPGSITANGDALSATAITNLEGGTKVAAGGSYWSVAESLAPNQSTQVQQDIVTALQAANGNAALNPNDTILTSSNIQDFWNSIAGSGDQAAISALQAYAPPSSSS